MALRIGRIRKNETVKFKCEMPIDTYNDLTAYAEAYGIEHGDKIEAQDLVPVILSDFFDSDKGFQLFKKNRERTRHGEKLQEQGSVRGTEEAVNTASGGVETL